MKLDQVAVAGEREGNSDALAWQRRAEGIVNVISSDEFPNVSGGNIGEFLRNVPGIVFNSSGSDPRAPRARDGSAPQWRDRRRHAHGQYFTKLDRGRYRFAFRARGTQGQSVDFELADGGRKVSKEAQISLTREWREHIVEIEIKTEFKDETTLRFRLPRDLKGTFDLGDPRMKTTR